MKRIILIMIMIILSITGFGCNRTKDDINGPNVTSITATPNAIDVSAASDDANANTNSTNSSTPTKRLVKKTIKAPYLVSNNLVFNEPNDTLEIPRGVIHYSFIQITGLENLSLQKRINSAIEKAVENAVRAYSMETAEANQFYCVVEFNCNNLLSISLRDNMYTLCRGFLYQLSDGKQLSLKDLFTTSSDYVSLINSEIPTAILNSELSEENILREPFTTIASNQNFCLSKEKLFIVFQKQQSGFANQIGIGIPRSNIDAYMDIIDKAGLTKNKPNNLNNPNNPNLMHVKYNNNFITNIGKILNTKEGKVSIQYPVISGLQDQAFEKKINETVQLAITKLLNNSKLKSAMNKDNDKDKVFAAINSEVILNHFGLIGINTFASGYKKFLDLQSYQTNIYFDLNNKKQTSVSDIFRNYALNEHSFAAAFTAQVKKSIMTQYRDYNSAFEKEINKKLSFDFIMNHSKIYLGCEDFQIGVDFYVNFLFHKGAFSTNAPSDRLEAWYSIWSLPYMNIDKFFDTTMQ